MDELQAWAWARWRAEADRLQAEGATLSALVERTTAGLTLRAADGLCRRTQARRARGAGRCAARARHPHRDDLWRQPGRGLAMGARLGLSEETK
jgi:hypothetical protein